MTNSLFQPLFGGLSLSLDLDQHCSVYIESRKSSQPTHTLAERTQQLLPQSSHSLAEPGINSIPGWDVFDYSSAWDNSVGKSRASPTIIPALYLSPSAVALRTEVTSYRLPLHNSCCVYRQPNRLLQRRSVIMGRNFWPGPARLKSNNNICYNNSGLSRLVCGERCRTVWKEE